MKSHSFPRAWLVLAAASALTLSSTALAGSVEKTHPELAGRKAELGPILVLTDAIVVDDIGGKIEKIKLDATFTLASATAEQLQQALVARGYTVRESRIGSLGAMLDTTTSFTLESSEPASLKEADSDGHFHGPFFRDPQLQRSPELGASWRAALQQLSGYARKTGKPAVVYEGHQDLADSLGCDILAVGVITCWGIPTSKKFGIGALTTLASAGMITAYQNSRSTLMFALMNVRTGEVLWYDSRFHESVVNESWTRSQVDKMAGKLP